MDIDITKYAPIIADILLKLKVPKSEREDMTQECYVALLEKQKHLEHGIEVGDENNYAATICKSRMRNVRRKENQSQEYKPHPEIHFDSLSDPRVYRKAAKIGMPKEDDPEATSSELDAAILTLPFDEYRVVYELFVSGKTHAQVAKELGIDPKTVWNRSQRGIKMLKEYFEVEG